MIAAHTPQQRPLDARLLVLRSDGSMWQRPARIGSIMCTRAIWSWRTTRRRCPQASVAFICDG